MDLIKIGNFLKRLRKENKLTQEQFAEIVNVSNRTVSRWENGKNMPDLDILIEISKFYDVELREILDGERRSVKMDKDLEETVLKVADYNNDEKIKMMGKLHFFSWLGVLSFIIYLVLKGYGFADSGIAKNIAEFCAGVSFGMLIIAVIYTSNSIYKIKTSKQRIILHQ